MRAIILAAGRGSRMKNLTDEQPKCLVELHGKTLLELQLEAIKAAGISEIAIVTGYKREMLAGRGIIEFHNPRWAETQMVASLVCAGEWLQEDTCIVSYSDIFYEVEAVKLLMECNSSLAVTYDPNWLNLWEKRFDDPLTDAETFRLNSDNTLAEIGKKPQSVEEVQGQYMGLLRLTPLSWKEFLKIQMQMNNAEWKQAHMTGILQKIVETGNTTVTAIPYKKTWGEIDSIEDLNQYA